MRQVDTRAGWKHIGTLFETGSLVGLTDRQLVDQFLAGESAEAAFEALVDRHGPMVRSVCRSILRDRHEADDAFQATFLVLARRAGSIRSRAAVASWLFGVARRVAAHARADAARRRLLERYIAERASHEPPLEKRPAEAVPEVLEEVERLSEHYRAPIVLCYLEGRSHAQAARTLGCPLRTVQTRLERAKAKLRDRLIRRGLAPGVGLLAIGIESAEAAPACSVPAAVSESTARASLRFAASPTSGPATTAITLALGVIRSLVWNRFRRAAAAAFCIQIGLVFTFLALAPAFFAFAPSVEQRAKSDESSKRSKTIAGRVVDDHGRPVAGAHVWLPVWFDDNADRTSHTTADAQGNFILPIPESWFRAPLHERLSDVWAFSPGHRIASANAATALAGKPGSVALTLGPPSTDTSFIVLGPDGHPAVGAVVEPSHILAPNGAYEPPPAAMLPAIRSVTDRTGRAVFPAIARAGLESVTVTTRSVGAQQIAILGWAKEPAQTELRLRPAGRIEGRIVASRPEWARGVKIVLSTIILSDSSAPNVRHPLGEATVTTGDDGTFTVPAIAEGKLSVYPRFDQRLPARPRSIGDVLIQSQQTTKCVIFLQKAVRVRGSIRVRDSHEPVVGASIDLDYLSDEALLESNALSANSTCVSDSSGKFDTFVLPGIAKATVISLPEPFVRLTPFPELQLGVNNTIETVELATIEVARGITIAGQLVDSQDRPIADAYVGSGGAAALTDQQGYFTMLTAPPSPDVTYRVALKPIDGTLFDAEIVQKNPLLLRAAIDNTGKVEDRAPVGP